MWNINVFTRFCPLGNLQRGATEKIAQACSNTRNLSASRVTPVSTANIYAVAYDATGANHPPTDETFDSRPTLKAARRSKDGLLVMRRSGCGVDWVTVVLRRLPSVVCRLLGRVVISRLAVRLVEVLLRRVASVRTASWRVPRHVFHACLQGPPTPKGRRCCRKLDIPRCFFVVRRCTLQPHEDA